MLRMHWATLPLSLLLKLATGWERWFLLTVVPSWIKQTMMEAQQVCSDPVWTFGALL